MGVTSRHAAAVLLTSAALATCATNTAPPRFLPSSKQAQTEAYGGWIELRYLEGGRERRAEGELIAVTQDTVWVLGDSGGVVLATGAVRGGKLTAYTSGTGAVTGYTALGVVSTISNGLLLIFTAPLWILTGTVAGASQSYAPERRVPPLTWADLGVFARFPQGRPAEVRLDSLEPKVRMRRP